MMKAWNDFLASLGTRGGAIFLLSCLCGGLVALMLHLVHHGEMSNQLGATVTTTFASFSGALLLALKGSSESTASATVGPSGGSAVVSDAGQAKTETPAASEAKQEGK